MENHITVLTHEATDALRVTKESTIVDVTLGAGGHSKEILKQLGSQGVLVGIDADPEAVQNASLGESDATVLLTVGNFRNLDSILDTLGIQKVDGVIADLGWRIEQMSGNGKGFSFMVDEPLLMTFGDPKEYPFTAQDIVNDWRADDIQNVLKGYGEERFSGRIARAIVESRTEEPITHSKQLADIIYQAVPGFYRKGRIHPATRTFQALRITVNDEFDALEELIKDSVVRLKAGGRLAIISFHSLEDRIVKRAFKGLVEDQIGTLPHKKPITATDEERKSNPRARSAKLRTFKKNEETK